MIFEAAATLEAALVAGIFGLLGVWIGFTLSRLASEGDRREEALFTMYQNIETVKALIVAFQRRMIDKALLHEK